MELSVGLPKTVGLLEKKNQAQMREASWSTGGLVGSRLCRNIGGKKGKRNDKGVNRGEKVRKY